MAVFEPVEVVEVTEATDALELTVVTELGAEALTEPEDTAAELVKSLTELEDSTAELAEAEAELTEAEAELTEAEAELAEPEAELTADEAELGALETELATEADEILEEPTFETLEPLADKATELLASLEGEADALLTIDEDESVGSAAGVAVRNTVVVITSVVKAPSVVKT